MLVYLSLMKPRIIPLLLVPTVAAMLIAGMQHAPSHPLLSLLMGPLGHGLLGVRNRETLRRFKEIAEGTRPWPSGHAPQNRERASATAGAGG